MNPYRGVNPIGRRVGLSQHLIAEDLTLTGLTQGSILFAGPGGLVSEDNARLWWDDTDKSLAIGPRAGIIDSQYSLVVTGDTTNARSALNLRNNPGISTTDFKRVFAITNESFTYQPFTINLSSDIVALSAGNAFKLALITNNLDFNINVGVVGAINALNIAGTTGHHKITTISGSNPDLDIINGVAGAWLRLTGTGSIINGIDSNNSLELRLAATPKLFIEPLLITIPMGEARLRLASSAGKLWELVSGGGGLLTPTVFGIYNTTDSLLPFQIVGAAPTNSFSINSSGTVVLGGQASPQLVFNPITGATLSGQIHQTGDTLHFATSGVGNHVLIDLSTGATHIAGTVSVATQLGVGAGTTVDPASGIFVRSLANLTGTTQVGVQSVPFFGGAVSSGYALFTRPDLTDAIAAVETAGLVVANPVYGVGSSAISNYGISIQDQNSGINNYALFISETPGTNKWAIYASGGADSFHSGRFGIGSSAGVQHKLYVTGAGGYVAGGATHIGAVPLWDSIQLTATGAVIDTFFSLSGASPVANITAYNANGGLLNGSSLTTYIGFQASQPPSGGTITNAYAFRGVFNAAAGVYNLYMDGTAPNYLEGQIQAGAGSEGVPAYSFFGDTNTGFWSTGPGTGIRASVAGNHIFSFGGSNFGIVHDSAEIQLGSASLVILTKEGNGILAQRNNTVAQAFRIYNTFTDAINYDRLTLKSFDTISGRSFIGTEHAGTGTARTLAFGTGGIEAWAIQSGTQSLLALTDNLYDIGAVGANRPRTGYFGTSVEIPAGLVKLMIAGIQSQNYASNVPGGSISLYGGQLGVDAVEQVRIVQTPSAVNYLQLTGNTTGGGARISAQGETNVALDFISKGNGSFVFWDSGGAVQFQVLQTALATRHIQLLASVAGNPTLSVSAGSLAITPAVVGASTLQGTQLISTVATGTPPLSVSSTTLVANLNSDLLDGLSSTAFALVGHGHAATDITSGTMATARLGSGTANATTRLAGDQTWKPEWTKVDKTADTSRPSTIALSADPTLTFAVAANTKYSFRFVAVVSSFNVGGTGPNLDWRLTGPSGFNNLTVDALTKTAAIGSAAFFLDAYSAVDHQLTFPTGAGPRYGRIIIEGEVSNGGTAGNIAFKWAQTASSTNATIVKAGSYLEYRAMP